MADDEVEAIQAIFCQPGELCVIHGGDGSKEVKVKLQPTKPEDEDAVFRHLDLELCLFLPPSYPSKVPDISVWSDHFSRKDITQLRAVLNEKAAQSLDQPMLMDLITVASEELHRMAEEREVIAQSVNNWGNSADLPGEGARSGDSERRVTLLHLDHMRARTQYIKLIKKWAGELGLTGRLVFCQRLILIVLQGSSSALKEYIVRQRTCNMDVDSRGQPCKERMLSVLCDLPLAPHHHRLDDFQVVDLNTADDLKQFFTQCSLDDQFLEHIRTVKHFPGR